MTGEEKRETPSDVFLQTPTVWLRNLRPSDRAALIDVLTDPETMKWVLEDRAFSRMEAENYVEKHLTSEDAVFGMRCIVSEGSSEPIGLGGYRRCAYLDRDDVEFGWIIAKAFRGRGYATELGREMIRHAFSGFGLKRILAACNPANAASEHILRDKLQMRFEREVVVRPDFRRRVYVDTA